MLSGISRTFLPKLLAPLDTFLVRVAENYGSGDGVQDGGRSGRYHVDWNLNSSNESQRICGKENGRFRVLTVHGYESRYKSQSNINKSQSHLESLALSNSP